MRNKTVDALKGYAIILVVIGHAIESVAYDTENNKIYQLISSFHMPLFMFLSGYIICDKVNPSWILWLWKRVKRLVIPFFIWLLIWAIYRQFDFTGFLFMNGLSGLKDYIVYMLVNPLYAPWFLMVLFMLYCVLLTVKYLEKYLGFAAYIWMFLVLCIQPINSKWAIYLLGYYPFFFIGYLTAKHRDKLPVITPSVKMFLCGLFIPLVILTYCWSGDYEMRVQWQTRWLFHFSLACLGIAASYSLISLLRDKWISRPLARLGLYTLDIYVLNIILISVGIKIYFALFPVRDEWLYPEVIFVGLFSLIFSIGVSQAIRRSSALKSVLFGD